jgi:hypothetical protein
MSMLLLLLLAQHSELQTMNGGHPLQCRPSSNEGSQNQAVFQQLNQYRQANGVGALAYDALLEQCIEAHCHHMSVHGFFSHNAPEPQAATPWVRASACGTSANAENIARYQRSATAVMNAWKGSPGHNANMLNGNWTRVGCGYYEANGPFWGQLFATGPVAQTPTNTPPPAQQPPPPTTGGGPTTTTNPPPPTPNSPAGATADPYGPGSASQNTSSTRREAPPEKKIVQPGLLKR